jgi:hypothetical protein
MAGLFHTSRRSGVLAGRLTVQRLSHGKMARSFPTVSQIIVGSAPA